MWGAFVVDEDGTREGEIRDMEEGIFRKMTGGGVWRNTKNRA
jgi:hypothetical protein